MSPKVSSLFTLVHIAKLLSKDPALIYTLTLVAIGNTVSPQSCQHCIFFQILVASYCFDMNLFRISETEYFLKCYLTICSFLSKLPASHLTALRYYVSHFLTLICSFCFCTLRKFFEHTKHISSICAYL